MNEKTRILVVDDDPHLLQGMSRILKSAGYETIEAATGTDCLRFTIEQKPDLILLDVMLPDINGIEVCKRIKSDKTLANSYVVFLSSLRTSSDDQAEGLETGADGYIARPVSNRELLARVESLLRLKISEQALKQSEERFRRISSMTSDISYSCIKSNNAAYSIDWIMGAVERITGHSEDDVIALGCWSNLVFDEDLPIFNRKVIGLAPGMSASCELRLAHKTGKVVWVASFAECVLDTGSSDSLRLYGALVDITERKLAEEALRQSEDKFSKTFFLSPDAIIISRLVDGMFISVNEGFEQISGYLEEEVVGKTALEINIWDNPEDRNRVIEELKAVGKVVNFGFRFRTKNGDIRYGLTSSSIIVLNGVEHILNVTRDITEIKLAEEDLRESEEKYRGLVESISDVIFEIDRSGVLTYISPVVRNVLGYETEDLIGMAFLELVYPDDRDLLIKRFSELSEGVEYPLEYRLVGKSGVVRYVRTYTKPIMKEDTFEGARGTLIDITERKLSAKALMESEGQKQAILDGIKSNIAFVNEEMKILWANKTAADSVGKLPSQMIGKKCHSLWADSDKPCEGCPTIKAFKTKKSEQITMVTPDGRVWEERGEPVFDAQGNLIGVVEIALDITERVRAEEERESLRSQLLQAQKMEAIGTLAGGVAHDFNNLLQIALGYSEILLNDKSPNHPDYSNLHTINTSAKRGADLVQRLMVFSRKGDTKPRSLNLNHEVTQVKKLLERTIPKMIAIELSLESWLPVINADPVQVEQILLNLAINAKDAMPEAGGKLTIETRNVTLDEEYCRTHLEAKQGQYVMISVSDTGHGMTQETVQHIFEPFFTTKGVGKGTGLGLAMVYGIMKHHEGFINCYSELGHGTTFRIYFPVVQMELEEDLEQERAVPQGGSETILLVDDEESLCDIGSQILTRAGYTVLTATNGRDALDLYRNQRSDISLVLLDLIMPGMGGKECFQELVNINPQVRVILSSGFLSNGTTEEARVFGVRGFVEKPYNMRQLLGMVRDVLDED